MTKKVKVVLDTNVYLSGIIFTGTPRKVLLLGKERKIKIYTSISILFEIAKKLNEKFFWDEEEIKTLLKTLSKITEIVYPSISLQVVKDDPTDNKILECAKEAKVPYIITGDKHLLKLEKFENIKIIKPAEFLDFFKIN